MTQAADLIADTFPFDGERISTGNADFFIDSPVRGWFVGSFLECAAGLRKTRKVEVKWSSHSSGDRRVQLSPGSGSTSLAILVSGKFSFEFPGEEPDKIVLTRQGDYVVYGPSVAHNWEALEDSVVITVRWPSDL
ncbi:signal peptidase I [Amycolatopsis sp. lyj-346]|uniref:signal peptidase I n=1 Tax=Amycolatopsis sp. lyj-346 TaxID=2789289 RepID=UPI00397DD28C